MKIKGSQKNVEFFKSGKQRKQLAISGDPVLEAGVLGTASSQRRRKLLSQKDQAASRTPCLAPVLLTHCCSLDFSGTSSDSVPTRGLCTLPQSKGPHRETVQRGEMRVHTYTACHVASLCQDSLELLPRSLEISNSQVNNLQVSILALNSRPFSPDDSQAL